MTPSEHHYRELRSPIEVRLLLGANDSNGRSGRIAGGAAKALVGDRRRFFLSRELNVDWNCTVCRRSNRMTAAHATFLRYIGAFLGVLAAIFPGRVFFETAVHAIRTRTPHVDIPVALAIGVGTVSSLINCVVGYQHIYFDSIASLILLLRVGRYLQFRAQYQAGLSLDRLFRWTTPFATRIDSEGNVEPVATTELKIGDTVFVKAGEALPVDGRIVHGESTLDCAWLTGESLPLDVREGDAVVGGTLNLASPLKIQVEAVGEASRIGRLNHLIRQAASQKRR